MNVGPYLKGAAGFLGTLAVNIAYRLADDSSPLPALDDGKGWLLLVITVAAATAGIVATPAPGYIRPARGDVAIVQPQAAPLPEITGGPSVVVPELVYGRHARHALPE